MYIDMCNKEELSSALSHAFSIEAFRYNTEIDNWNNPVICIKENNKILGALYFRHFDDCTQIVNIYSDIKGGGTALINYFIENIAKDVIYLYMSKEAVGFYKKFNLYPILPNKPSEDFQLCVFDKDFNILSEHRVAKEKLKLV